MVYLEEVFVPTRYPGYFWNVSDNKLYSCKIDGVLKPLKLIKSNEWFFRYPKSFPGDYYNVSVKGQRKIYPVIALKKLETKRGEMVKFPVKK